MNLISSKVLKKVSDNALGDRVKTALRWRAPKLIRPFSSETMISELFPWRVDDTWNTRFDVANIPSIVFPEHAEDDTVSLYLFDQDGSQILKHEMVVSPFSSVPVTIGSLISNSNSVGTFACFHKHPKSPLLTESGSMITERNYVSYRRQGEKLWNYVHGNTNALAKINGKHELKSLTGRPVHSFVYSPQFQFNDCSRFELVYINPLSRQARLSVRLLGPERLETGKVDDILPARGLRVITIDNTDSHCHMIENNGDVPDWRPIIFKFYESHFDVLHG